MNKQYITERNLKGERYVFYMLDDDIHIQGPDNCFGYPNYISIYPMDIFGHEDYGTTRHVAMWKLKELRKTYNRLIERGIK